MIGAKLRIAVAGLMLTMTGAAYANNFLCGGPVNYLAMSSSGLVNVDLGFGIIGICNVSSAAGQVSPDACRSWYASLLTARSTGKRVTLYWNVTQPDNVGLQFGACTSANFGSWTFRPPYHFQLEP